MDDLEELRRRKMQGITNQNLQELNQLMQLEAELKKIMPFVLNADALKRLMNIKAAKPDFALQVQVYLLQMYQAGQIPKPLTDGQLKAFLDQIVKKQEWRIKRR